MSKARQKGTAFETLIVNYLKSKGFIAPIRPALTGIGDTGDINGIRNEARQVAVQCKNQKTFKLSEWLNATKEQAGRLGGVGNPALPVLVVKRPGMGKDKVGKTYAVLELDDLADLLQEAGYR